MSTPRVTVVGSYATGLTMKVARMPSTGETVLGSGYRVDYGGKGSNQCRRMRAPGSERQLHRQNRQGCVWRDGAAALSRGKHRCLTSAAN